MRLIDGSKNILDARYFLVNRLASKCIQRHGLNGLSRIRRVEVSGFITLSDSWYLKFEPKRTQTLGEGRIF
jgi:hypothetical protein